MTKSEGSKYEAPRAMRLSDAALGFGAFCTIGTNASGSCVTDGASAYACNVGNNAGATCSLDGQSAIGCQAGNNASGTCTTIGNTAHGF